MIEVPAAAIAVKDILAEVDFVNVGTNDLLQYFVAADRDNEAVLGYGDSENKAFLWLLRFIIQEATELSREKDVTICGEVASHPQIVPLLLTLGFRSLSITPTSAQVVRNAIANTDLKKVKGLETNRLGKSKWVKGYELTGKGVRHHSSNEGARSERLN
jgi:phosphotransferase system enzyme I (PtsI)